MTANRQTTDQQARRVLFFGRVQGVGFRFTTAGLARDIGIRGYVRNCPDGSVELVAQGAEGDIERLVAQLDDRFAGYIENRKTENYGRSEAFACFEVRR